MTVTVVTLEKVEQAIDHLRTYGQHDLADVVESVRDAFLCDVANGEAEVDEDEDSQGCAGEDHEADDN